ncbi:MAG: hypothetical protein JSS75_01725 [Bacteroidetes bacterium]|nr:hypothetical protein [Bacteroidota bacterium]
MPAPPSGFVFDPTPQGALNITVPPGTPPPSATIQPPSGWVFTVAGTSQATGTLGQWSNNLSPTLSLSGVGTWTLTAMLNAAGNNNTPATCSYNPSSRQITFTDPTTSQTVTVTIGTTMMAVILSGTTGVTITSTKAQGTCTIPAPGWVLTITPTGTTGGAVNNSGKGVWSANGQNQYSYVGPGNWTYSATFNGAPATACIFPPGQGILTFMCGSESITVTVGSYNSADGSGAVTFQVSGTTLLVGNNGSSTWFTCAPVGWVFSINNIVVTSVNNLPPGTYSLTAQYNYMGITCAWNNAYSQVTFTTAPTGGAGTDSITTTISCAGGGGH